MSDGGQPDWGTISYTVTPGPQYAVERHGETPDGQTSCKRFAAYMDPDTAYEVAYALCEREHDVLGYPKEDNRIQYPERPEESTVCHRVWPG